MTEGRARWRILRSSFIRRRRDPEDLRGTILSEAGAFIIWARDAAN
jgi:hypothetical protein